MLKTLIKFLKGSIVLQLFLFFLVFIAIIIYSIFSAHELPSGFNSNLCNTITNNQYELLRVYVNNYIENNIDYLIVCAPYERVFIVQDNIVLNNYFNLNLHELNYVSKYISSLNDNLINNITVDYHKRYPLGYFRFK